MTIEIGGFIGLAALMIGLFAWLRQDVVGVESRLGERIDSVEKRIDSVETRLAAVEHGQAKLEGLLEGLREAICHSGGRAMTTLSQEAMELLVAAVEDQAGKILRVESSVGVEIHINEKRFGERDNPRSAALWESAINELLAAQLIRNDGPGGYMVTQEGYQRGDRLAEQVAANEAEAADE